MSRTDSGAITHTKQVRSMEAKLLEAKTLEIHYYLDEGSHAIDAKAFYACQQELVGLIDYVAMQLHVEVSVKTVALNEGGIKAWLKAEGKKQILIPVIVTLVANILGSVPTESIGTLVRHEVEEWIKSPEIKELEHLRNEKERLILKSAIDSIKANQRKFDKQSIDTAVRSKRSNYYKHTESIDNLKAVEFIQKEEPDSSSYIWKKEIPRAQFHSYLINSTELDPIEVENVHVEIVAPVLKGGSAKWRGIYNQEVISFSVLDPDFLDDVSTRKVSFSNGSAILCSLQEKRKINNKGEEIVFGYEVVEVYELQSNGTPQPLPPRKKKTPPPSEGPDLFSGQYDQA